MEIRHHRMHHEVVQGYDMSSKQLDEMWRYENILAHYLLDLPLRQCSATPSDKWGKEMNSVEFLKLKGDVRKMWCRAGQMFVAFKCNGDDGWGLKVREDLGKKLDPDNPVSIPVPTRASSSSALQVHRPTKTMKKTVHSYVWCTYCGINLDDSPSRVNRKEHWALHHTVHLCKEINVPVNEVDPAHGVNPKKFKCHLETVDSVLRSLRDYNYLVIPASHFFTSEGIEMRLEDDETGKKLCFERFIVEARAAFRKYKVIYLCGLKFPESYIELLPVPNTAYRDVVWLNNVRPRSNQFAILKSLSPDDRESLSLEISTEFENIIMNLSLATEQDS